jgi:hypothetical protein
MQHHKGNSISWIIVLFFVLNTSIGYAQLGGGSAFAMLELPSNARTAGIGGQHYTIRAQDPSLFLSNPALLSDTSKNYFGFQYGAMPSQVNYLNASFNTTYKKLPIGFAVRRIAYGTMDAYDDGGNPTGTFAPSDYAITAGTAYQTGPFRLGANLHFLGSNIEQYSANAIAFDLGALFIHPTRDFTIAVTARNTGFALSNYTTNSTLRLPFNLGFGMTYKLEHMPLRFSLTSHNWQRFDITYLDPNKIGELDASGNEVKEQKTFFDNFARHFVIGGEFLLGKAFNVRVGYNHLINRELKLEDRARRAGWSYGFMVKIKGLEIAYSRAIYSVAGGTNFVGVNMALNRFFKKTVTTPKQTINS